jgi:lysozyme
MAKFDKKVWGGLAMAASIVAMFEGRSLVAYLDPPGIPTICYGHTGGVSIGDTATPEECEGLLAEDLKEAAVTFDKEVKIRVAEETRAALISFIYNAGSGSFKKSTLLKKLNAGDIKGACNELPKWVYAGGKRIQGLVNRRKAEQELCLKGIK